MQQDTMQNTPVAVGPPPAACSASPVLGGWLRGKGGWPTSPLRLADCICDVYRDYKCRGYFVVRGPLDYDLIRVQSPRVLLGVAQPLSKEEQQTIYGAYQAGAVEGYSYKGGEEGAQPRKMTTLAT